MLGSCSITLTKQEVYDQVKEALFAKCKETIDNYLNNREDFYMKQWFALIKDGVISKRFLSSDNEDDDSVRSFAIAWCQFCSEKFFSANVIAGCDDVFQDVLLLLSEPGADVELKMWLNSRGKESN